MLFKFTAYFELSFKGAICSMNTFKNSTRAFSGVPLADFKEDICILLYHGHFYFTFQK